MRRLVPFAVVLASLSGAADAAAKTDSAAAAARGCDRVDAFRYDVTVTGAKSGRETWPPESGFSGEFALSYDYVVRYARLRVVVDRGCDPEITTVRARGRGTGTLRDYTWADRVVPKDPSSGRVPCEFGFTTDPLGASLRLVGGTHVLGGGPATFSIGSQLNRTQQ